MVRAAAKLLKKPAVPTAAVLAAVYIILT